MTVYLVESGERRRALTELGLGAHELVLVATTDADAAEALHGLSPPGTTIIDLRHS